MLSSLKVYLTYAELILTNTKTLCCFSFFSFSTGACRKFYLNKTIVKSKIFINKLHHKRY